MRRVGFAVDITDSAEADLLALRDYLKIETSREHADASVDEIVAFAFGLATMPFRHRRFDYRGLRWRVVPYRRHLIFYRIEGSTVSIMRVIHQSRDLDTALAENLP